MTAGKENPKAERASEALAERVDALKDQAGQAVAGAKDAEDKEGDQAREAMSSTIERTRNYVDERSADLPNDTAEYARQARDAVSRQVGEMPIATILAAGVVGYMLAYAVHGKR